MDTRSVFLQLLALNFVYAADPPKAKEAAHSKTTDSGSAGRLNSDDRSGISDIANEFQRKLVIQESESELQTEEVEHRTLDRENESFSHKVTSFEQIGGHHVMKTDQQGFLLKPSLLPGELQFYRTVTNSEDATLRKLASFIPEFGGTKIIRGVEHIYMKNIVADYDSPCIMDIKMGFQIWDPTTLEEKIAKRKVVYVAMRNRFHFCIQGLECINVLTGKGEKSKKVDLKFIQPEDGVKTLYRFVNGRIGLRAGLVEKIVEQLEDIASWFEKQRKYNFYASSIFLTYDASDLKPFIKDEEANHSKSETYQESKPNDKVLLPHGVASLEAGKLKNSSVNSRANIGGSIKNHENFAVRSESNELKTAENELKVRVRMIDFNHALESSEKDENYLSGLRRLIKVFENLDALNENPKLLETLFSEQDAKVPPP